MKAHLLRTRRSRVSMLRLPSHNRRRGAERLTPAPATGSSRIRYSVADGGTSTPTTGRAATPAEQRCASTGNLCVPEVKSGDLDDIAGHGLEVTKYAVDRRILHIVHRGVIPLQVALAVARRLHEVRSAFGRAPDEDAREEEEPGRPSCAAAAEPEAVVGVDGKVGAQPELRAVAADVRPVEAVDDDVPQALGGGAMPQVQLLPALGDALDGLVDAGQGGVDDAVRAQHLRAPLRQEPPDLPDAAMGVVHVARASERHLPQQAAPQQRPQRVRVERRGRRKPRGEKRPKPVVDLIWWRAPTRRGSAH
mmetsp:Transcript_99389/g.276566  ORF Transcript_99389/g.276566 Transcript_99389/m.276566 type:complete len:307 (-) Transcript_99389:61-981(-)